MKFLICFMLILGVFDSASAGVLERIRLEDAVQSRVERGLKEYDKNVRVELSFSFRKNEALPGTTMATSEDMQPTMVEEADITKINVKVYASSPTLTPEVEEAVYRLIPVRKGRIKVSYEQLKVIPEAPVPAIKTQDLNDVTMNFAQLLSKILMAIFGTSILLIGALALYMQQKGLRRSREHFDLLAKSFGEQGAGYVPQAPVSVGGSLTASHSVLDMNKQDDRVASLPVSALKELFADCYWCEKDQYAHWLWKQILPEQKKSLFLELPFLKNYSGYFISLTPREENFQDHPYYLAPENLSAFSQDALTLELKKNPGLWTLLSPMRQKNMRLPITDKLRLVQKPLLGKKTFAISQPSPERALKPVTLWSDMSFEDEKIILNNPQIVPAALKQHVRSLVWLSLKDQKFISQKLEVYDARTLASAWVGAPEVLEILEKHLPEKKLKLLKDYQGKTTPSRDNSVFQSLVDEGLMDEAA